MRTFDLARLDERGVGALMMHFMLETILAARLLGVDPFDQPAVELAKVITRERVAALQKSCRSDGVRLLTRGRAEV